MNSPFPKLLYAHRGAAKELPENTLESFKHALVLGANALEMDAHMTRDGVLVIAHDVDGKRMCGRDEEIKNVTYSELQTWDAGHGYVDQDGKSSFRGKSFRIPTLNSVLESFPDTQINIDVKQWNPSMVDHIIKTIDRHNASTRICLASFRARTLGKIRLNGYTGQTALSAGEVLLSLTFPKIAKHTPYRGNAAQIPTKSGPLKLGSKRSIRRLQRSGCRVDFWTINDFTVAKELLNMGADGIMTDDPRTIAPLFS